MRKIIFFFLSWACWNFDCLLKGFRWPTCWTSGLDHGPSDAGLQEAGGCSSGGPLLAWARRWARLADGLEKAGGSRSGPGGWFWSSDWVVEPGPASGLEESGGGLAGREGFGPAWAWTGLEVLQKYQFFSCISLPLLSFFSKNITSTK